MKNNHWYAIGSKNARLFLTDVSIHDLVSGETYKLDANNQTLKVVFVGYSTSVKGDLAIFYDKTKNFGKDLFSVRVDHSKWNITV